MSKQNWSFPPDGLICRQAFAFFTPELFRQCCRSARLKYTKDSGAHQTLPWEPLNQSAAALSGSFAPAYRFENLEIHKVFLRFPNLNLEQNPSLTALAIESEDPLTKNLSARLFLRPELFHQCCRSAHQKRANRPETERPARAGPPQRILWDCTAAFSIL